MALLKVRIERPTCDASDGERACAALDLALTVKDCCANDGLRDDLQGEGIARIPVD